jgi:hypothetical protein
VEYNKSRFQTRLVHVLKRIHMWLKMVDKSSVAVAPWVHHVYVLSCALQL